MSGEGLAAEEGSMADDVDEPKQILIEMYSRYESKKICEILDVVVFVCGNSIETYTHINILMFLTRCRTTISSKVCPMAHLRS